jgi:microcystin-dependent protein
MAEPFIGQIIMFGGNFAPRGWALCDGQLLSINGNEALFSILGTTYGGDGRTTFALPDLRGRFSCHPGNGPGLTPLNLGTRGGVEIITEVPAHTHAFAVPCAEDEATTAAPAGNYPAETETNQYTNMTDASMGAGTTSSSGPPSVAIRNPFTCVNYIIALVGIFPSRS